ncbi:Crp/Fnr family transcriptional regulator [Methylobacterium crusticola]|uniref:Crp/Fnr family transcriptional regulator n=1 Tax=Methylobacterium crusticola TaxID=1697972 RepID=UPI001EE1D859|nr:Crp/Fnr family transcriptional regulator [Methylobacterium crusticola]
MPTSMQSSCHNRLLAALSPPDFALLQPDLTTVPLRLGAVLIKAHAPIPRVYFVEDGILSGIALAADGGQIELALIGREGMIGTPVLLGTDRTPHEGRVQANGYAWCMHADALRAALRSSPTLHALLLRYVQALTIQIGCTALANSLYRLPQRLARWLLMCHDRTEGDELPTTHQFLSLMLGVNRPGLTAAVSVFERSGMIRRQRGIITIRDRAALLAAAGASYGAPEAEYARLIAGPAESQA